MSEVKEEKKEIVQSLDDDIVEDNLVLVSNEGGKFKIPRKVAIQSELVKTMSEGDKEESEIPLPNLKTKVLEKVIEYMQHHIDNPAKEIEKPLKSANMTELVSEWDAKYCDVNQEEMFDLILAANYMDIKPLLDLMCARVASIIKGKTTEEIRKAFSIVNDFTPEEEAAIIAENKWAEEA